MLLARCNVERERLSRQTMTLEKTLPYADQQADYQAFFCCIIARAKTGTRKQVIHYRLRCNLFPITVSGPDGYGILAGGASAHEDAGMRSGARLDQTHSTRNYSVCAAEAQGVVRARAPCPTCGGAAAFVPLPTR